MSQLVRQEMGMAHLVDSGYTNPFSDASLREQRTMHVHKQKAEQKLLDKLERKESRGPRLSMLRREL